MNDKLNIAGMVPFSTIDFPGRLSAVLFCQGCSWNCHYCHNPHLRPLTGSKKMSWNEIVHFLESRRGLLEGVVFSGGEPLLQPGLPRAVALIKGQGFSVGLHTAGVFPERLAEVISQLEWVGFDVKGPWEDYSLITSVAAGAQVIDSLRILVNSKVEYEVRTTVDGIYLNAASLLRLAKYLASMGVKRYVLQKRREVDSGFLSDCFFQKTMKEMFSEFFIR
jgi:pyruvate formate lyase activating enzyme